MPDAKRPDLRWTSSTFPGAFPTELKIADNWSGPHLFERLERQLAGAYPRDGASSLGIYLLVWRGVKPKWELLDGRVVDFPSLIAALQAHWKSVADTHAGVEEIEVIGIDLTKRGVRPGRLNHGGDNHVITLAYPTSLNFTYKFQCRWGLLSP